MPNEDLHLYVRYSPGNKQYIIILSDNTNITQGTDGKPLFGIFDDSYFNAELGNTMIQADSPKLTVVQEDIKGAKLHDKVKFDNTTYDISDMAPDGTGMCVLTLGKF